MTGLDAALGDGKTSMCAVWVALTHVAHLHPSLRGESQTTPLVGETDVAMVSALLFRTALSVATLKTSSITKANSKPVLDTAVACELLEIDDCSFGLLVMLCGPILCPPIVRPLVDCNDPFEIVAADVVLQQSRFILLVVDQWSKPLDERLRWLASASLGSMCKYRVIALHIVTAATTKDLLAEISHMNVSATSNSKSFSPLIVVSAEHRNIQRLERGEDLLHYVLSRDALYDRAQMKTHISKAGKTKPSEAHAWNCEVASEINSRFKLDHPTTCIVGQSFATALRKAQKLSLSFEDSSPAISYVPMPNASDRGKLKASPPQHARLLLSSTVAPLNDHPSSPFAHFSHLPRPYPRRFPTHALVAISDTEAELLCEIPSLSQDTVNNLKLLVENSKLSFLKLDERLIFQFSGKLVRHPLGSADDELFQFRAVLFGMPPPLFNKVLSVEYRDSILSIKLQHRTLLTPLARTPVAPLLPDL